MSNYERLKKYIENGLKKKLSCLYFKINRDAKDQFTDISFAEFEKVVNRAYGEVAEYLSLNTSRFVDATGPNEIISVEITYL